MLKNIKLGFLCAILLLSPCELLSQSVYGPINPNYYREIVKTGSGSYSSGLIPSHSYCIIGKNMYQGQQLESRIVLQWDIPNNIIPDNSIISNVTLYFTYTKYQHNFEMGAQFSSLSINNANPSQAQLEQMWTQMSTTAIGTKAGVNNVLEFNSNNPNDDFNIAIRDALVNDRFALGIIVPLSPSITDRIWHIQNPSVTIRIEFIPPTKNVIVNQLLLSSSSIDSIGLWNLAENKFDKYNVPKTFTWNVGDEKTLQGSQKLLSNQKYKHWEVNSQLDNNVVNHKTFEIFSYTENLTSQFNPAHSGVAIKNNLEATGIDGGILEFKDPWLIDYPDPDFGNTLRNRGMAAPFKELTTPFTFTYSSDYKGIFLGQLFSSGTYYSLKMPDEQPIIVHNQSRKFFPYGWEETGGVTVQYPWAQETGVVFNSSSNVATAVLKGQLMSKEQTGISSNSQRKMVRTDNGIYHVVYESMGSVWYTHSLTSNYFGNWSTDKNLEGRNPGLAYNGNKIIFVYETINPNNSQEAQIRIQPMTGYDVGGVWIYDGGNDNELVSTYSNTYFGNAKPVIAFTSGQIFVVYRKNATEGLKERTKWNTSGNWSWESEASIPQTNANSINPAVTGTFGQMHIVFESLATIQYKFAYNQGASWRYNNVLNLSSGSGFSQNYYPSISISDGDNLYVMVSWQGVYTSAMDKIALKTDEYGLHRYAAVARVGYGASWGGFSNFSNYVKYTNNNSINALAGSILAWSENNGQVSKYVKRRANGLYDPIEPLSTNGIHPIISNGSSFENIKAMAFNTSTSAPYLLNRCNNDFFIELLQKESTEQLISYGRSGVVEKDGIEFLFNIGDVSLNGNTIKFIERVDTLPVTSIEEMNSAAVTETFNLNSSSELIFSNYYYVVNKNLADSVLGENYNLTFKSELVKASDNEVVGTFDVVSYNKYNLDKYANLSYLVDCAGIESGEYFMRLTTTINDDVNLYLSDIQRDDIVLEKSNLLTRNFKGESIPVSYSLEQNYPNPFNPSTTIRYQIPQDGIVTLKVYDILGSEVATLVNEQKTSGRYEVNFDASRLASGVYIYKLQAGSYIQSKKMLLVK